VPFVKTADMVEVDLYREGSVVALLRKITTAIERCISTNRRLITIGCHEVSISGKIMCELSEVFSTWDVDMEYNRSGADMKRGNGALIRPDIIIHRRGEVDGPCNLAVIEVKKGDDVRHQSDINRLVDMTKSRESGGEFSYLIGVFLKISENGKATFLPFHNGREL